MGLVPFQCRHTSCVLRKDSLNGWEKKQNAVSKAGKYVFLILVTVPLSVISQRHIIQVQPDILAFPQRPPHIKKTSVAFGTFAFTADLWGLSAQGGKLPFIIQTLQKKKANWQAGVLSTSLPIGGHSSWRRVT